MLGSSHKCLPHQDQICEISVPNVLKRKANLSILPMSNFTRFLTFHRDTIKRKRIDRQGFYPWPLIGEDWVFLTDLFFIGFYLELTIVNNPTSLVKSRCSSCREAMFCKEHNDSESLNSSNRINFMWQVFDPTWSLTQGSLAQFPWKLREYA